MRDTDVSLESLLKLLQPGMPKVVPDQWSKFLQDPLFQRLQLENSIAYSPFRDRPIAERRSFMMQELQEGFITVAVNSLGLTLRLVLDSTPWLPKPHGSRLVTREEVCLDETGLVHLRSRFVFNGVCVIWLGSISTDNLCGKAHLQFDCERAEVEMQALKEQLQAYHRLHCGASNLTGGQTQAASVAGSPLTQSVPHHHQRTSRLSRSATNEAIESFRDVM